MVSISDGHFPWKHFILFSFDINLVITSYRFFLYFADVEFSSQACWKDVSLSFGMNSFFPTFENVSFRTRFETNAVFYPIKEFALSVC